MNFIDLRLKVRHFFRKNRKLLIIVFIIWAIVFLINQVIMNMPKQEKAETTYEAHTSIMHSSESTPTKLKEPIENIIKKYVDYLNEGNYESAFSMISEDCRKYAFNNDIVEYMSYVYTKLPTAKEYAIQSYSNVKYGNRKMYIYEVKYFEDMLATGLTNSEYKYTQENITFYENDDKLEMNVGNYIYHIDIKSISENEYLKIDVVDKLVNYSIEKYEVKFTNRSNYTIVIADAQEDEEINLALPNETRKRSEIEHIVLEPNQSLTAEFTFPKFVDDGDSSQSLVFSSIRVMEKYSGTENVDEATIQSEIDNAIAKFSMDISVAE